MTSLSLQSPSRLAPSTAHGAAFVVWAALAASGVFWGVKLFSRPDPIPSQVTTVGASQSLQGDPLRLFAAPQAEAPVTAAPVASTRYKLYGVVAPAAGHSQGGVATLSVDGGPARAYRVGAVVEGDAVLLGISQRGVQIGPRGGAADVVLTLAPMQGPATGARPSATGTVPMGLVTGQEFVPGPDMPPLMMEPPSAGRGANAARAPASAASASAGPSPR